MHGIQYTENDENTVKPVVSNLQANPEAMFQAQCSTGALLITQP